MVIDEEDHAMILLWLREKLKRKRARFLLEMLGAELWFDMVGFA